MRIIVVDRERILLRALESSFSWESYVRNFFFVVWGCGAEIDDRGGGSLWSLKVERRGGGYKTMNVMAISVLPP